MQIIKFPGKDQWASLLERPVAEPQMLDKKVRKILDKVKSKGDKALRKFTHEFDGVKLKKLLVSEKEIEGAADMISSELKAAMQLAKKNIEIFHRNQVGSTDKISTMNGVSCWRRSVAIDKVGLYIPGGTAPLFSTVLMLGVPANLAGCKEIILCTPPQKDGNVHPAILYAAELAGIRTIFKIGGAQAIAAMAYGTESVPRVYKIFGPGNQYVNYAKQLVQREQTSIDMPAGPSEVCVLADESANPAFVAADLLSQAEHGPDSQVLLITTSNLLADMVLQEIDDQSARLPRQKIATSSLENSRIIVVNTLEEGVEMSNAYASEHLIINCINAETIAMEITNAGSVFIGPYSPESIGDYASGTNHVLPTNGFARAFSGVSVDSFVKKITYQQVTPEGIESIGNAVIEMARAEGLAAHAAAVQIRMNK